MKELLKQQQVELYNQLALYNERLDFAKEQNLKNLQQVCELAIFATKEHIKAVDNFIEYYIY